MRFLEIFNTKKERSSVVGKYETSKEQLAKSFTAMMDSLGLSNPATVRIYSSQAVTVSRKGNNYVLVLNTFKPPIKIEWSGLMPIDQLAPMLLKLAEEQKKIAYINTSTLSSGTEYFQLALS